MKLDELSYRSDAFICALVLVMVPKLVLLLLIITVLLNAYVIV